MPNVPGKGFVYDQPAYDSVIVPIAAAGAAVAALFAIPRGQLIAAGIPKTIRHTSLVQAGRLETGNSLNITAISFNFPSTAEAGALPTVADKRSIRAGSLRIVFGGDTEFLKMPLSHFPSGGAGEVVVDGAVALNDVQNGVAVAQNKYYLDNALVLSSQESVSVFLENMDAVVAPTEVQVVLWGEAIRPVR